MPQVALYARFDVVANGGETPKYSMSRAVGYYPPFEKLVGRDGKVSVYLMEKCNKDNLDAPEMRLQAKGSLNLTGLKGYFVNGGMVSTCCYGNPPSGATYGGKKPKDNPFYPDCIKDAFLFLFDDGKSVEVGGKCVEVLPSFEMLVLSGAKVLAPTYCQMLAKGGFDGVLNELREQADINR